MSELFVHLPEIVPIFPLGDVVLFPRTILPLHIFEPRYRAMMADALTGDRFIAIALLKPGCREMYFTRQAPIFSVVGIGRIAAAERAADGTYNVLLQGVGRGLIEEEYTDRVYRRARVARVECFDSLTGSEREQLISDLRNVIATDESQEPELRERWRSIVDADIDLDEMADLLAGGLPSPAELRQRLLEESETASRVRIITAHIQTLSAMARSRPRLYRDQPHDLN